MIYQYDGTYEGFLTSIFNYFEYKPQGVIIQSSNSTPVSLFEEQTFIETNLEKANRVRQGLKTKVGHKRATDCYKCFLSEDPLAIQGLFDLLILVFQNGPALFDNYGNEKVLYFHQTIRKVNRERHRMQAFIRFQSSTDGIYFAVIDPDFNVLPLIITFFKDRYADQEWMIYDTKRNYGVMYNGTTIEEVVLTDSTAQLDSNPITLTEEELKYQNLWKGYFTSTNIVERKNMKLHLRHVPRRYWKYLIEKQ